MRTLFGNSFAAVAVLCTALTVTVSGQAQVPGTVRSQMQELNTPEDIAPPSTTKTYLDYREEMRTLVQSIASFAHGYRRNFAVVTGNGFELVTKAIFDDQDNPPPARAYLLSIDGIVQESLFFGRPDVDMKTDEDLQLPILKAARTAKDARRKVLVLDYAAETANIDAAIKASRDEGFVPFIAPAKGLDLNKVPPYPKRPLNENGRSIVSLSDVSNFLWLEDTSGFGNEQEFALAMHNNNFDMVVVDVFHGRQPLSKQAVETLKYKKLGARRLVLARMNIGMAAAYRFYWQPGWSEGNPLWIGAPVPGTADQYFVEYWQNEWKNILIGGTRSYLYGIIDQGFDGVVLEGLNAYRYWERGVEAFIENQP